MINRFNVGDQFTWKEEPFQVAKLLPNSRVNIVNLETGELVTHEMIVLARAVTSGEAVLRNRTILNALERAIDWSDIRLSARETAEYRLTIIQPLLGLSGPSLRSAIDSRILELATGDKSSSNQNTALSRSSVYRWLKNYRDSGEDPRSLVPDTAKCGNKSQNRIHEGALRVAKNTIENYKYLGGPTRTTKQIHREIAVRIEEENADPSNEEALEVPSPSTVHRLIKSTDKEGRITAVRQSRRQAPSEIHSQNRIVAELPLRRVEIDHTRFDVIVVDERNRVQLDRPWVTFMLDVDTRYPLGFYIGFEQTSVASVMQCLRHAILPKPPSAELGTENEWLAYGIPYELVIDNGKEFVGRDLEDACLMLGTTIVRSPVKTPQFKASVERLFRTTNTGLAHNLPGATMSNPEERGSYDSIGEASITLDELYQLMHIFLIDIYAQELHTGLNAKPAEVWEAHQRNGFFPLTRSAEELRWMLGRVAFRTVQHYGIEFENLIYNSSDLATLFARYQQDRGKKFKIKYDPVDLGEIAILDPERQSYIFVPAVQEQYAKGKSLWVHRKNKEYQRREYGRVDPAEMGRAQRKLQAIVEQSNSSKSTRRNEARWLEGGGASASGESWDAEQEAEEAARVWESTHPAVDEDSGYDVDWVELGSQGIGLSPGPSNNQRREQ
jgi:putative transposase